LGKQTFEIGELNKLIQIYSSISFDFHQSGHRTNKLKQIALDENKLCKYKLPKYFDISWIKFTYCLQLTILRNWKIVKLRKLL
jgi:hypothetical protein